MLPLGMAVIGTDGSLGKIDWRLALARPFDGPHHMQLYGFLHGEHPTIRLFE